MQTITCPHCGTSRNMPQERLPSQPANARCPQCFKVFQFIPSEILPAPAAQHTPAEMIACPHCGLGRHIPGKRITAPQATLSCRRCQQSFRLEAARSPQPDPQKRAAQQQLMGIGALLTNSWERLCSRGWSLLSIYLLASLLIFAPLLLASLILPQLVISNRLIAWICLLTGLIYGLVGATWMTATLFQQLSNPHCSIFGSLVLGWQTLGRFAWLLFLLCATIGGGSVLLVIPGIIFSVWFAFCCYILAEEGTGGLAALEKSHQLVRGHWWTVCSRMLLLLLVAVAVSTLAGRLPLIGGTVNFVLTLLLIPFSLFYFQLIYQDLKGCQPSGCAAQANAHRWRYLCLPTLGWLLIPGVLFYANSENRPDESGWLASPPLLSELIRPAPATLAELTEEHEAAPLPGLPLALSTADYERLLSQHQLVAPAANAVNLGPATLATGQFWADPNAPQLWLTLTLAELPNLDFSSRHSARVLIDRVNDSSGRNLYHRQHSLETAAFQWVDILSGRSAAESYSGIRTIQLKPGTQAAQINGISGRLELQLPLGIESQQLGPADIGRTIQLAGKQLRLEALSDNQITLTVLGKPTGLLSVRAFGPKAEPLREAGASWQQSQEQARLRQMFSGRIESVTLLVAAGTLTRSYPFAISHP